MPKIPVYPAGGQVDTRSTLGAPRRTANVPSTAFGAGDAQARGQVAQSLNVTNDVIAKRSLELKAQADKTAVDDWDNQARQEAIEIFNKGSFQATGKDAQDLYNQTKDSYGELRRKYEALAKNDSQRQMLNEKLNSLGDHLLQTSASIQAKEMKAYNDTVLGQTIEVLKTESASNINDGNLLEANKQAVLEKTDALVASKFGADADANLKAAAREKALTDYHKHVITAMLAQDRPKTAQAYFKKYGDEIDAGTKKAISDELEGEVNLVQAQDVAEEAMADYGDDMAAALKWVRENTDGEVEKMTTALVRQRFSDMDTEKARKDRDRKEFVSNQIKNSANLVDAELLALKHGRTPDEVSAYRSLAAMVHETEYKTREAGRAYETEAKNAGAEAVVKAKARAFIDETIKATGVAPTELEIAEHLGGKVKGQTLKEVIDYATKGGMRGNVTQSRISAVFKSFNGGKLESKADLAKLDAVFNYVVDNLPPGTDPDDLTLRRLVARGMVEGSVSNSGVFWDDDMTFSEAIEEGTDASWLPDMPEGRTGVYVRNAYRAVFGANGSKTDYQKFYKDFVSGDRPEKELEMLGHPKALEAAKLLREHGKKVSADSIVAFMKAAAKKDPITVH